MQSKRKFYLDNLRTLTILLLFPYHTFMIYNNSDSWYVHGQDIAVTSFFIDVGGTWMMPLLFAVAGIATSYALRKRSIGQYAKERFNKLLIPFVFGVILLVPVQSYIAGLYFSGTANYLDFFTTLTDLTGYDGAFTPGQLWFLLYLFLISIISIPVIALHKSRQKAHYVAKGIPLVVLILFGVIPVFTHEILNVGGKSLGEYFTYFLFGYLILSKEEILEKLDQYRFLLLGIMIAGLLEAILTDHLFQEFFSWINILAILGLGRHYLNFNNKATSYLTKSSFGIYLFHQSWIVIVAYFILPITDISGIQIILILASSIVLTFLTYEGAKRVKIFRWMFGLKN